MKAETQYWLTSSSKVAFQGAVRLKKGE